ncbi:MAG: thiamine pyrophosphate-requiring protein [Deltaproteobacteria bacterium]|nr:thiamine pyrophosphate-requiring protein [Deltaproteobacteria bacterium]
MQGRAAIANILKLEGVEHLLCFPNNAIIDAAAEAGIRPICARTERVAVNIADGLSRVSSGRRIGVCAVQYGPGSENMFAGVAQAYSDASPILLLPAGVDRRREGIPPNFQAIHNYRGVTKWVEVVNLAHRIPQMLRRAFTLLRCGKPGPVMLEIPTDVMTEEIPDDAVRYVPVKPSRPVGDPQDVREAVRMLLAARAPVIVAGQGILYAEAWEELRGFAEPTRTPVLTTLNGKSAFPEDHPLALGAGGLSGTRMIDHFLRKADLVFGLGTSFTRSAFIVPIPPGKTIVQVTIDEQDVNKDYPIAHAVIGDAKAVLRQLLEEVIRQAGPHGRQGVAGVAEEVRAVKEAFLREWMPRLTSDDTPISPYRVIWDLMRTVDRRRTILTHDAGNPRDQILPFYESLVPHGYIGWGKSTQLGTGLGLAMGAKLAAPDKLAVHVAGDAGFGMTGMDFETAVRSRIPILAVVLNNGVMGGYEKYLPVSTARYRLRYLSGDYSRVAEALGGYTERVEKPHEIIPALRRAIEEVEGGRAALLEIMTREEPTYPTYW